MTIQTRDFDDLSTFLQALRPSAVQWWFPPSIGYGWVYRGQADSNWPIRPRLWRPEWWQDCQDAWVAQRAIFHAEELMRRAEVKLDRAQWHRMRAVVSSISMEQVEIREFARLADEVGLDIDLAPANADMDLVGAITSGVFSDQRILPNPVAALAQHHGIPTRLVDWTRNPMTAAYFAAEDAYRRSRELGRVSGMRLVVWAVNAARIKRKSRVHVLRLPTHKSTFVRAQRGVFLFDKMAEEVFVRDGRMSCLSEALDEATSSPVNGPPPAVIKLTLPWAWSRHLMGAMILEGFSRAHLMPTLDNVAIIARQHLDQDPSAHLLGAEDDDELLGLARNPPEDNDRYHDRLPYNEVSQVFDGKRDFDWPIES